MKNLLRISVLCSNPTAGKEKHKRNISFHIILPQPSGMSVKPCKAQCKFFSNTIRKICSTWWECEYVEHFGKLSCLVFCFYWCCCAWFCLPFFVSATKRKRKCETKLFKTTHMNFVESFQSSSTYCIRTPTDTTIFLRLLRWIRRSRRSCRRWIPQTATPTQT